MSAPKDVRDRLTDAHRSAWIAGTISHAGIAKELGCSRQRVAQIMRERGWVKPPPESAPASAPPAPADPLDRDLSPEEVFKTLLATKRTALAVNLEVLSEVKRSLRAGRGHIDPRKLSTLQQTSESAARFIFDITCPRVKEEEDSEKPLPEMVIRVMTDAEEQAVRDEAEREFAGLYGGGDAPAPVTVVAPDEIPAAAPEERADNRLRLRCGVIPDRAEDLPEWLRGVARASGVRSLRQLASRLGIKVGLAEPADLVIERITYHLDNDLEPLRDAVEVIV